MANTSSGIPIFQAAPRVAVNPLDSLIQGIQQGAALQQMPQQLQNNQINQMMQQALLREKLLDLQDPNRVAARQVQQQLAVLGATPGSGYSFDPATAQAAALLGPIAQPGTVNVDEATGKITQATSAQEALQGIMAGNKPSGFVFDPSIPRAAQSQANINEALQEGAKARARNAAKVIEPTIFTDGKVSRWIKPGEDIPAGFYDAAHPPGKVSAANTLKGFDTATGLYGVFQADENGMFPDGVVPASQAPKAVKLKAPSTAQVDQLAGFDVLEKRLEEIKKTPQKVRASNVGWIDSVVGSFQSATGLGTDKSIAQNEAFRTAVNSLVGEFSFGRGGKALTVTEKKIIENYLPRLVDSNAAFESRLGTFEQFVKELKASRLQALEDSGYDVSRFSRTPSEGATPAAPAVSTSTNDPLGIR